MYDYHFEACYISRFLQQLAPRIPASSALGSIDHFRSALHVKSLTHPFSYISIPVQAIIAALSVHSSTGGKVSLTSWKPRAVRKEPSLS